jgi:hypothetical protein
LPNCNSCGILIEFVENGFKSDGKIKWKVLNGETKQIHICPKWKPKEIPIEKRGRGIKCPICKKYTESGSCFHKL